MFYRVRETVSNGLSVLCVVPSAPRGGFGAVCGPNRKRQGIPGCAATRESGKLPASGGEWRRVASSGGQRRLARKLARVRRSSARGAVVGRMLPDGSHASSAC